MNYFEHKTSFGPNYDECLAQIKNEIVKVYSIKNNEIGGDPQLNPVRLHSSTIEERTAYAAIKAILQDKITMGENVIEYEDRYKHYLGKDYGVLSCNSGSSANLLVIATLVHCGILKAGDKVVVPSLCWSTTVFPLVQYGLVPVFCDAGTQDFNLDTELLDEICRKEKPKALFLIHTYGCPSDMDSISAICETNNITIIEDTCESMGAEWRNQKVGTFGIASTFSTYFSHHICTLEGGLTAFKSSEHLLWAQSIRSHGWVREFPREHPVIVQNQNIDPSFLFAALGYNLRLSEPQAAMGIQQLEMLDSFVEKRSKSAAELTKSVQCYEDYFSWLIPKNGAQSSWFGFPLVLKGKIQGRRGEFRNHLKNLGIESRPFLVGDFTQQPIARGMGISNYSSKVVTSIMENGLAVPCHQSITQKDINRISQAIETFVEGV